MTVSGAASGAGLLVSMHNVRAYAAHRMRWCCCWLCKLIGQQWLWHRPLFRPSTAHVFRCILACVHFPDIVLWHCVWVDCFPISFFFWCGCIVWSRHIQYLWHIAVKPSQPIDEQGSHSISCSASARVNIILPLPYIFCVMFCSI